MAQGCEVYAKIATLPFPAQQKICAKLARAKDPEAILAEVDAGFYFARLGFAPEYENLICGKTPDWYLPAKGETPAFLVEAVTKHLSLPEQAERQQIGRLEACLHQIPLGVILDFYAGSMKPGVDPEAVAAKVENWLRTEDPKAGGRKCVHGIVFRVVKIHTGANVRPKSIAYRPKWRSEVVAPLRNAIKKKITTYRPLRIPLVVAVAAKFFTGVDWEDFEEALFGRSDQKGLFARHKSLSGGLWIPTPKDPPDRFRFFRNEHADSPAPQA